MDHPLSVYEHFYGQPELFVKSLDSKTLPWNWPIGGNWVVFWNRYKLCPPFGLFYADENNMSKRWS